MALFDFFKKKEQNSQKPNPVPSVKSSTVKNNLFSKSELEQYITTLSKMGYLFQKTSLLMGGRNETMKSRLFSYAGILGYYYENEYNYGRMANLVDQDVAVRHALVSNSMRDASHKRKVVAELADNLCLTLFVNHILNFFFAQADNGSLHSFVTAVAPVFNLTFLQNINLKITHNPAYKFFV